MPQKPPYTEVFLSRVAGYDNDLLGLASCVATLVEMASHDQNSANNAYFYECCGVTAEIMFRCYGTIQGAKAELERLASLGAACENYLDGVGSLAVIHEHFIEQKGAAA